jgi:hypothetical protein
MVHCREQVANDLVDAVKRTYTDALRQPVVVVSSFYGRGIAPVIDQKNTSSLKYEKTPVVNLYS